MTTNLDALIAEARMQRIEELAAELRQERERADEAQSDLNAETAAHADTLTEWQKSLAALSRAEETIEKVRTTLGRAMSRKEWREDGWEVPAIEVQCALDAIEYNEREEED